MHVVSFVLAALAGLAAAAPNAAPHSGADAPSAFEQRACSSKYKSCGAPHQPPCCGGLWCNSGTCWDW